MYSPPWACYGMGPPSEVFWCVLLMILSQTFKKIIVYGVAGVHQQVVSSLDISASHHGGLQGVKIVMVYLVDDPRNSATPIFYETVNGPSTHHNTFDTLKASILAGFADIEAFREPKGMLGSC